MISVLCSTSQNIEDGLFQSDLVTMWLNPNSNSDHSKISNF